MYSDEERVLVTVDDNVPVLEVSDSNSTSIGSDFAWLAKVQCRTIMIAYVMMRFHKIQAIYEGKNVFLRSMNITFKIFKYSIFKFFSVCFVCVYFGFCMFLSFSFRCCIFLTPQCTISEIILS